MKIHQVIATIELAYGQMGEEARVEEVRIEQCEQRLGTNLPYALRTLYMQTGNHQFHHGCDDLVALEQMNFEKEFLVFYTQDQGAFAWGINRKDINLTDPQVWAIYDDETIIDSSSVSSFLAFEAAWQAINGGALPHYGILDEYSQEQVAFSPAQFESLGEFVAKTRHGEVRCREGAILLHRFEGEGFLGLAAATTKVFHETAKHLGVSINEWTISSFEP